jgi:hypothetical protein
MKMKRSVGLSFSAVVLIACVAVIFTNCNLWISRGNGAFANHASWMQDNLATLGDRTLPQLVLPASHDAAMYPRTFLGWGRTQCLSIHDQLENGVRWFDLRPEWADGKFRIHHGPIAGPDWLEVLGDLKRFAEEHPHELILLKLSHYSGINQDTYVKLSSQVTETLGPWLLKALPEGKRLAGITLSDYVRSGTKILVLADEDYPINHPAAGIWVYADWYASNPARADLRVYDIYSNTNDFNGMVADQFRKFEEYDGRCRDGKTDCDLFLLSWTITPRVKIWAASQPAMKNLSNSLAQYPVRNKHGKIMNLIYVDFVEFAGVTDVAIAENKRLNFH